jgi:asparagine synthase (glutamine-hydrolysing)
LLDYLRDPDGILTEYVDRGFIDHLLEQHSRGTLEATDRIWRLLNLQVWGDMYVTGRRERLWDGLLPANTRVQFA